MKKHLLTCLSGVFSGLLIGFGSLIFTILKPINPVIGAFLFSFGLFTIISLKLNLYTGKIGYLLENKPSYLLDLLFIYIGNLIGALLFGYVLRLTSIDLSQAEVMVNAKLSNSAISLFILSIFCGMLIFLAVELQKAEIDGIFKLFGIIGAIMLFILSGFEHCIADMVYISFSNMWSLDSILFILIVTLGNSVGSILLHMMLRLIQGKFLKK